MTVTATPDEVGEADRDVLLTGPERRCLVTRQVLARAEMLRFVAAPDGQVVFDAAATLPGRGLWLSASGDVVDKAVRSGAFSRGARAQLRAAPDLRGQVAERLKVRIADFLGLARRGGGAVAGFEKAREWLAAGKAGLVVQAVDGSAEERARFLGHRDVPVVTALPASVLGRVFGRERAVHVAVAPGRLAMAIQDEARRLMGVAGAGASGQSGARMPADETSVRAASGLEPD